MRQVHQFRLDIRLRQYVSMPRGTFIRGVTWKSGNCFLIVDQDRNKPDEQRSFILVGDDQNLPDEPKIYIGSVLDNNAYSWHVYEELL